VRVFPLTKALASLTNMTYFYLKFVITRLHRDTAQSRLPVIARRLPTRMIELLVVVPAYLVPSGVGLLRSLDDEISATFRALPAALPTQATALRVRTDAVAADLRPALGNRDESPLGDLQITDSPKAWRPLPSPAIELDGACSRELSGQGVELVSVSGAGQPVTGKDSQRGHESTLTAEAPLTFKLQDLLPSAATTAVVVPLAAWMPEHVISLPVLVWVRRSIPYQIVSCLSIPLLCVATLVSLWYEFDSPALTITAIVLLLVILLVESTRVDWRLMGAVVGAAASAVAP
jgi:hypothetical protein